MKKLKVYKILAPLVLTRSLTVVGLTSCNKGIERYIIDNHKLGNHRDFDV